MVVLIVFIAVAILLMVIAKYLQSPKKIEQAHAGGIGGGRLRPVYRNDVNLSKMIDSTSQRTIDSSKYMPLSIIGKCLEEIGFHDGDLILAELIDKKSEKEKEREIKSGDVLLIYLFSWKFRGYKIRVFDRTENGAAKTYYFNADGSRHYSSKNHDLSKVVGIVRYTQTPPRKDKAA